MNKQELTSTLNCMNKHSELFDNLIEALENASACIAVRKYTTADKKLIEDGFLKIVNKKLKDNISLLFENVDAFNADED